MVRIAIDGPGGAGKSSVAKAVAKRLGIIYVDTGALYRSIGLHMLKGGISISDTAKVISELDNLTLELKFIKGNQVILLDGEDVKDSIRTPEVSMAASAVSAIPEVREYLLNMQRATAKKNSVIMDGRDIGTVILPNAEVKIFLTASAQSRAKRRYDELCAKGISTTYEQVYDEMVQRDKNDSTRAVAPCVPAEDAVLLDNSYISFDETVESVIKIINSKTKKKTAYMKIRSVVAPIYKFFQRIKVTGVENIPEHGGVILCSNHIAIRDVFILGVASSRQIRFVAKKELFSVPIISSCIKFLGAIKLDRKGTDIAALKASVKCLKEGDVVAIFPQGHRYPAVNPATTPTKNGAALIAYHSHADVVPLCIKTKGGKYGIFKRVEVIFGKPIKNSDLGFESGGSSEYKAATDKIFEEIIKLGDYSSLPAYITPPSTEAKN